MGFYIFYSNNGNNFNNNINNKDISINITDKVNNSVIKNNINNFNKNKNNNFNNFSNITNTDNNNTTDITYNHNNTIDNNSTEVYNTDYSNKNIPMDNLFMDLNYIKTIKISNYEGNGIIKIYQSDGQNISFDIRDYSLNLYNPYCDVDISKIYSKYGDYYLYTFTPKNKNISKSYCYYKKVGKYYIMMAFTNKTGETTKLWDRWNLYIYKLYKNN